MLKGADVTKFVFLRESLPDRNVPRKPRLVGEVMRHNLSEISSSGSPALCARTSLSREVKKRHTRKVCLFDATDFPKIF
jgi:hypothetical protein